MRALRSILSSLILLGALAGCVVYGGHGGQGYGYSGGYGSGYNSGYGGGYNNGHEYTGDHGESGGSWHRPYNGW
jgi:hypothetical protein